VGTRTPTLSAIGICSQPAPAHGMTNQRREDAERQRLGIAGNLEISEGRKRQDTVKDVSSEGNKTSAAKQSEWISNVWKLLVRGGAIPV